MFSFYQDQCFVASPDSGPEEDVQFGEKIQASATVSDDCAILPTWTTVQVPTFPDPPSVRYKGAYLRSSADSKSAVFIHPSIDLYVNCTAPSDSPLKDYVPVAFVKGGSIWTCAGKKGNKQSNCYVYHKGKDSWEDAPANLLYERERANMVTFLDGRIWIASTKLKPTEFTDGLDFKSGFTAGPDLPSSTSEPLSLMELNTTHGLVFLKSDVVWIMELIVGGVNTRLPNLPTTSFVNSGMGVLLGDTLWVKKRRDSQVYTIDITSFAAWTLAVTLPTDGLGDTIMYPTGDDGAFLVAYVEDGVGGTLRPDQSGFDVEAGSVGFTAKGIGAVFMLTAELLDQICV